MKTNTMLDFKDGCYDCGLPYDEPEWADFLVPNNVWEMINPTKQKHKGAGLLCVNCIVRRCAELGLDGVPFLFASGPFSYHTDFNLNKEFIIK